VSGGHFNYKQHHIEDIADEIARIVKDEEKRDITDRYYEPASLDAMKEACKVLLKAEVYARRIDWLVSGDDSDETFAKLLHKELSEVGHANL